MRAWLLIPLGLSACDANPEAAADADGGSLHENDKQPACPAAPEDTDAECGPSVDWFDTSGVAPTGSWAGPTYFRVRWTLGIEGDEIFDYAFSETPTESAYIEFRFYDAAGTYTCKAYYDLSLSSARSAFPTKPRAPLFASFDVALEDGISDCQALAPGNSWGQADIRDVIEGETWGVAFGPMRPRSRFATDLEAAVVAAGYDWDADWAPYVFSAYLYWGRFGQALETDYALSYATDGCWTALDDSPDPKPVCAPLPEGIYQSSAFRTLDAADLQPE